jgi:NAD(P)H-hydrate repair Nnr-like enzyme with NAD(P)H-hydrate dehydratase domain
MLLIGLLVVVAFLFWPIHNQRSEKRSNFEAPDQIMQKAADLESGKTVKGVARETIVKCYDTDKGRVEVAMHREWRAIAVLTFVARAHGQMREGERAIIVAYVKRWCDFTTLNETELDSAVRLVLTPGNEEFKRIVRELKKKGNQDKLQDLLDCAQRIVATKVCRVSPPQKVWLQ